MSATVLLAHGSPDTRHARTLEGLRTRVAARVGPTRLAFLEHDLPRPSGLAPALTGTVSLVPLLITPAHHARVDVPAARAALASGGAQVHPVPSLGGHPLLLDAVAERLAAAGHDPDGPVLLVAGGSSSGRAAAGLADLLARHAPASWHSTTLRDADPALARGRVVIPFVLAEGVIHDRVAALAAAAGAPFVPGGLADSEPVPALVAHRVESAMGRPPPSRAS